MNPNKASRYLTRIASTALVDLRQTRYALIAIALLFIALFTLGIPSAQENLSVPILRLLGITLLTIILLLLVLAIGSISSTMHELWRAIQQVEKEREEINARRDAHDAVQQWTDRYRK